ncbi:MAG: alpha/beta fold hydrolase [SAR202 cluster bacterium]|nr:alpha/beta fold hydrolase [SAR202 cluster bacterium]
MYAQVNGTRLFYETLGEGKAVFFLHGGLGFDHTYFRPWIDPLSKKFRVVYYDHRGNGRSDGRDELAKVDHSTWIADLDALRDHLGFEKFVLVGHSYGGVLGLEYALRYQKRLAGLVLMTTLSAWDYWDVAVANAREKGGPAQVAAVKLMDKHVPSAEAFTKLGDDIISLYFKRYDPAIGAKIKREGYASYQAYNRGFVECLPKFNVVSRLKDITAPTLVLAGRDDWITPVEQAERIQRGIKGSKLVVFEESGHFPFIEEQERYLRVLGDWISGLK